MVSSVRKEFNKNFTQEKYKAFLREMDELYPAAIEFRLAETPVFVSEGFTAKMLNLFLAIGNSHRQGGLRPGSQRPRRSRADFHLGGNLTGRDVAVDQPIEQRIRFLLRRDV